MECTPDRFRSLLHHLPDGFALHQIVLDDGGKPIDYIFLEVNPAFEALTGVVRGQIIGHKVTEVLPGIAASGFDWIGTYGRIALTGESVSFEQYSEPLERWYAVTAYRDAPGQFVTLFHDVTERRRTEEALRSQRTVTEQLLEQTLAGFWDWDIPGGIEYLSPTFKRMLGYEPQELPDIPESWQRLAYQEDLPGLFDLVRQHFESRGKVPFRYEVRYRHRDGSTIWVICTGQVIAWDERGNPLRMIGCHVDITEQKRMETALRQSEERYRALFELSNDAAYLVTLDGRILDVNPAWHSLLGYTPEDLAHVTMYDIYVDPSEYDTRFIPAIVTEGRLIEREARFKRKDGIALDCICSVVARRNEAGDIMYLQGLVRDVTAQKQIARALEASERKFRRIFEESRDAIYLGRPDGSVIDANQRFLDLFGYTRDDLLSINAIEFYVNPQERADFVRRMDEFGSVRDEVWYRRKDGSQFLCQRSQAAHKDDSGVVIAYQAIVRDITAGNRAEQTLRDSEEKYRTLFEQSMDAIALESSGGLLLEANKAYLDLFGYAKEDVGSINVEQQYTEPDDRTRLLQWFVDHDVLVNDEVQLRKKDGTAIDCVRNATVRRDGDGNFIGYQPVVRDITQQKRVREELERSHRELQRLTAHLQVTSEEERTDVAWELHDEVAQALSAITMDLHAVREKLPRETPLAVYEALDRANLQLAETIGRLRRLYSELRPGMLDDLGLAATIEWRALDFSLNSGIACRIVQLDGVCPTNGHAVLAMYRAFQEALDNVMRHSGATDVEVSLVNDGATVRLCISDNGRGITDEEVNSPASLGLASIRERLRALGGQLTVRPGEKCGTVVEVNMPGS